MKITGQILKENRERRGVTLNEVSLSTKITIKTLTAIEDGNPMNLPPKTFLRGFVRSYAIFLGLDPDEILKTFQEEMGSTVLRPAGVKDDAGEPSTGEDGRTDANSKLAEMNSAATEAVSTTETPAVSPEKRGHSKDVERILRNEPTALSRAMIVGGIIALIAIIVPLWLPPMNRRSLAVASAGTLSWALSATKPRSARRRPPRSNKASRPAGSGSSALSPAMRASATCSANDKVSGVAPLKASPSA